jgi:hypothetical protein
MVKEVVEIVIKEKGAKATSRGIKNVGRSSNKAAKAVGLLVGVLAGLAAFKGFVNLAADAVKASAAFETYGVTLRALLGSQQEANLALDNFVALSAKTPFAVNQIVSGATTLAAAALGNREKLEDLTQTAANLAAVTGLSFQEAASNLSRSLTAGIGAADLFREKGVRALIESIQGIPDATKLSTKDMDKAFKEIFGAGGTFGSAAENLSNTLSGALSNIGDAASVLQVKIGDAFAPAVINAAKQVFIPFLTSLSKSVDDNAGAFEDLAADGIKAATRAFTGFILAGLTASATIADLSDFLRDTAGAFLEYQLAIAEIDLATGKGLNKVFLNSDETVAGYQARVDELRSSVANLAAGSRNARQDTEDFKETLDTIASTIGELNTAIDNIDFSVRPEDKTADVDLSGLGGEEVESPEILASSATALQQLNALTASLIVKETQRIEPLDAALLKLEEQRNKIIELAVATGDLGSASDALALIGEEEARVLALKSTELERQEELQAEITRLIAEAVILSPELAKEIRAAADAAIAAGGGLQKVNQELADVAAGAKTGLDDAKTSVGEFAKEAQGILSSSIGSAVRGAITGEGIDGMQLLADTGAQLLQKSLDSVLDSIFEGLSGKDGFLGDLFGGGDGGFNLGGAISAGIGAGLSVLSGALRETSASISNDMIKSAATQSSAAATRGVIAGPTSIPIFQVGKSLEAAFGTTESLLSDILAAIVLGQQESSLGGGSGSGAALTLETTIPALS